MITFTVYILKGVGAWLTLLGFKTRRINLAICFATLSKLMMMLSFVRTIALNISKLLRTACKYHVAPLPAVFALENARVYVGTPDSCNETSYIEALIDDLFCRWTVLWIPNINLHNSHIQLRWNLADMGFWSDLKIWVALIIPSKIFESMGVFVFSMR